MDVEELKIQGEIDYTEQLIKERKEHLDCAEKLVTDTRDIAITINTKIHE